MDSIAESYKKAGIDPEIIKLSEKIENKLTDVYSRANLTAEHNQLKVISAMQKNRVSEAHFNTSTGYGYNDLGRDTLERVYADVFGTESALVRPQITCGTHALAVALGGVLRPGDRLVYISGKPYDTLEEVIGIRESKGSLFEYGIKYGQVDLRPDGTFDIDGIKNAAMDKKVKIMAIQRSRGYSERNSLSIKDIKEAISAIKSVRKDIVVMVDNCYGEFICEEEPSDVGADLVVGSLIKNPGGGLAPSGGYICGRKKYVDLCSVRLTSPGLGSEVGSNFGTMRSLFQGLFVAPVVSSNALKGAVFAAGMFEELGFESSPKCFEERYDIIQTIKFGTPDLLTAFCRGIQAAAPIDSYLRPEPWDMPGYDSQVIMAAGAFISGSSIELSADGPLKPPYTAYLQGGITYYHAKFGIMKSLQSMLDENLINFSR